MRGILKLRSGKESLNLRSYLFEKLEGWLIKMAPSLIPGIYCFSNFEEEVDKVHGLLDLLNLPRIEELSTLFCKLFFFQDNYVSRYQLSEAKNAKTFF